MKILAVMFTVAAAGSVVLVVVDLIVGRSAAGDLFIAFLNSLAAVALWWLSSVEERKRQSASTVREKRGPFQRLKG